MWITNLHWISIDIPASIAYFGAYEVMKRKFMEMQGVTSAAQLSPLPVLLAGGISGIGKKNTKWWWIFASNRHKLAFWIFALPPDTLKTRYQSAPDGTYKGMLDVYTKLMDEEGPVALFRGAGPAMLRSFPANAVTFMGAEVTKKALSFIP